MIAELVKQGKTMEEIATHMKEALAQIRHPKADRPVFTPEFLARIKRIIVFQSLGEAALAGICRKQVGELRRSWREKRGKELVVPDALTEYVAAQAHRLNERSEGKEGGRIVRKLLADWLEAPLQRAVSAQVAEYRRCREIVLQVGIPEAAADAPPGAPSVTVQFSEHS